MKNIIVAVDFSDCSINALEHAISIADKSNSNISMIWIKESKINSDVFTCEPENILQDVEKRFKEIVKKYQPGLKNGKIEYKIIEGKVYREIVIEAKKSNAFLIVAGTHGASGFEEFWAGSNANKLVSLTEIPVITIRGGVNIERDLTKILLPIDSSNETRQKASFTGKLAKYFGAKICILSIYTTKVKAVRVRVDRFADQVAKFYEEGEIKIERDSIETNDLVNSCIEYAQEKNANLISIMTEQEKTASNIWLGPYASRFVNHSPFPILSIHPKRSSTISLAR
ncbi:MAG: universal stress protein [Bacteroidales bacterium]|nr:universal stress protein [Bacteroidales bacterium]